MLGAPGAVGLRAGATRSRLTPAPVHPSLRRVSSIPALESLPPLLVQSALVGGAVAGGVAVYSAYRWYNKPETRLWREGRRAAQQFDAKRAAELEQLRIQVLQEKNIELQATRYAVLHALEQELQKRDRLAAEPPDDLASPTKKPDVAAAGARPTKPSPAAPAAGASVAAAKAAPPTETTPQTPVVAPEPITRAELIDLLRRLSLAGFDTFQLLLGGARYLVGSIAKTIWKHLSISQLRATLPVVVSSTRTRFRAFLGTGLPASRKLFVAFLRFLGGLVWKTTAGAPTEALRKDLIRRLTDEAEEEDVNKWDKREDHRIKSHGFQPLMTKKEAALILNLPFEDVVAGRVSAEALKNIHRTIMQNIHPDAGGSTYLSLKVNEARDVVLGTTVKVRDEDELYAPERAAAAEGGVAAKAATPAEEAQAGTKKKTKGSEEAAEGGGVPVSGYGSIFGMLRARGYLPQPGTQAEGTWTTNLRKVIAWAKYVFPSPPGFDENWKRVKKIDRMVVLPDSPWRWDPKTGLAVPHKKPRRPRRTYLAYRIADNWPWQIPRLFWFVTVGVYLKAFFIWPYKLFIRTPARVIWYVTKVVAGTFGRFFKSLFWGATDFELFRKRWTGKLDEEKAARKGFTRYQRYKTKTALNRLFKGPLAGD